jgi:hypothetical protein
MKKLLITYRATIDRHVPIEIKQQREKKKSAQRGMFVFFRERMRSPL